MADTYKGWNVDIKKKTDTSTAVVGFAQSMSVSVAANAEAVRGVGHLFPTKVVEGPREVTGSLEKMYGDQRLWDATSSQGTYFDLRAELSGGDTIVTKGAKFDSWDIDIPQDDFLSESADFVATDITVSGSTAYPASSASESKTESIEIDQKFTCEECGYEADSKRALEIHKSRAHSEEEDKDA